MRYKTEEENNLKICESFFVSCCLLLLAVSTVIIAQEDQKKPETVQDLFNTSSCIPKPYRCPHPQIEFYLYTSLMSTGRPVDLKRFSRVYGGANVLVFTDLSSKRRSQQNPEIIDTKREESLYNSLFNRLHPTKIVVHGFGGGRNLAPSTDMRDAYFHEGNYNIFIVDYGTLVKEPCLKQMEWAPRFCAKCIAQLIRYLTQHPRGVKADNMHLIGYSVGAHISGLVANYLNENKDGKLGRITGLDPTIVFYMGSNRSRDLDYTDAHFVDVLHTGAGILGQWGPTGHADFYINGGSSQPGCAHDTLFQTLACDHTKVTPYFIESIITKRGFWAYPCPNLVSYLVGWCDPPREEYVLMGEHVNHKARGIYYVSTNPSPPFAKGFPEKHGRPLFKRLPRA